jgi:Xaa-Pro aminopeptidase
MAPRRTALFLPEPYHFAGGQFPTQDEGFRRAVWNRPVRRLSPGKAAADATGIPETYPIDSFAEKLPHLVGAAGTVFLTLDPAPLYAPPGLSAPLSAQAQMARSIAEKLPGKTIADLTPLVVRMRLVKDAYEIASLRRAAGISGKGFEAAMREIRPGRNDREIAGLMEYVWKKEGSARPAFAPVVASGPDSMRFFALSAENYNAVDRVMKAGELLFVDYGAAEYRTYASDLCRTFPVSGRFTAEQRKYYEIVLEAQEAAIAAIRPGVMMLDVIKAAAQVFRRHDLESKENIAAMGEEKVWGIMPSPTHYLARNAGIVPYSRQARGVRDLGHHIGIDEQDSRDYTRPLEPGMVMTIEPKIYIPELGIAIMIEDMVAVTKTGRDVLSKDTPKKAADIERIMKGQ